MANTKIPVELSSTPGIVDNSNATAITIDSSENVGIGTSSPSYNLHVEKSSPSTNVDLLVKNTGTDATSNTRIMSYVSGASGGDPKIGLGITAVRDYFWRIDNSDSDKLILETNGTDVFTVDTSGNVGIGTSSPSTKLHVVGGAIEGRNNAQISSQINQQLVLTDSDNTNMRANFMVEDTGTRGGLAIQATESTVSNDRDLMLQPLGGRVGIGTTSPSEKLELGDGSSTNRIKIDSPTKSHFIGYDGSDDALQIAAQSFIKFQSGGSFLERMRIDSSGAVIINRTTTVGAEVFTVQASGGSSNCTFFKHATTDDRSIINTIHDGSTGSTSRSHVVFHNSSGSQVGSIGVTGSATTYNTSSDARLKDVTGEARGLEVINELNPVAYNWKESGQADEGLIAQEVLNIVPNAVTGSEEKYYQMDYSKLVVHLVKGMKEQQAQIEALQSEINELKNS